MAKTLEARREAERQKYVQLMDTDYGSTCHGQGAIKFLKDWRPHTVLDFGCGDNCLAQLLCGEGIAAMGLDWVNPAADILAPMWATTCGDGLFDCVTAFDSLEHLLPEDVPLVFDEMRRVSTPNGGFIFSIATRPSRILVKGQNLHPTVRPRVWWLDMIRAAGGHVPWPGDKGFIIGYWRPTPETRPPWTWDLDRKLLTGLPSKG